MRETQYLLIAVSRRSKNRPSRILLVRGLFLFFLFLHFLELLFVVFLLVLRSEASPLCLFRKGFYDEFVIFSVSVLVHEWCHFSF